MQLSTDTTIVAHNATTAGGVMVYDGCSPHVCMHCVSMVLMVLHLVHAYQCMQSDRMVLCVIICVSVNWMRERERERVLQ